MNLPIIDFEMPRQRTHSILAFIRSQCIRITPPLTISEDEIREGCAIMIEVVIQLLIVCSLGFIFNK